MTTSSFVSASQHQLHSFPDNLAAEPVDALDRLSGGCAPKPQRDVVDAERLQRRSIGGHVRRRAREHATGRTVLDLVRRPLEEILYEERKTEGGGIAPGGLRHAFHLSDAA